jgi:hypothetical protein
VLDTLRAAGVQPAVSGSKYAHALQIAGLT